MTQSANRTPWVDQFLPGNETADADRSASQFNLASLRGLIFRQRSILAGVTGGVLVVGLIITVLMRPIYQASATVRVDPDGTNIVEGQDLAPTISSNEYGRYLQTQGIVLKSRRMAYDVVDSAKLADNDVLLGGMIAKGKPGDMSAKQWLAQRRERAANAIQQGLLVEIPLDNRVLTINFRSGNAALAAQVANAYADNFVQDDLKRNIEASDYAVGYLKDQIAQISQRVQAAERAANTYARENKIVGGEAVSPNDNDEEAARNPTITVANLAEVNGTYSAARTKRIQLEQRWHIVANMPAQQLPEVQQNNGFQQLLQERARQQGVLSQVRARYGDGYPQVAELNAQIAALDVQLGRIANDIKSGIREDFVVSAQQERGLAGELERISVQTLAEQDRRVQFNLLQREASALRKQLAALLQRYNEIASAAQVKSGSITKIDSAPIPQVPVSPVLFKNLALALVVGVALAVTLAVLREAFDDRLRNSEEAERKLGIPLLGFTPYIANDEIDAEVDNPFSSLMESYATLRSSIDFALPGDHRILQVTSSQPSEGKSLSSSVLARKYAQLGHKTLLVDADLRKPTLASLFGAKRSAKGFAEVLLGTVDLADALIPSGFANLDVLPVGAIPPNPVELLSSPLLGEFIARYRAEYSLIIFDSSPVMGLADAPLLARLVDGTLFVVEANRSHYGQAKAALRRLRGSGGKVLGAVLTKYRSAEAGLSYDYMYYYYAYGEGQRKRPS